MTKHLIVFTVTFAIGVVIAVILRTSSHKPYDEHRGHPAPATASDAVDPHAGHTAQTPVSDDAHKDHDMSGMAMHEAGKHPEHDAHDAAPAPTTMPMSTPVVAPTAPVSATVNTICPGCGDPVDPKLPFADYKGKKIGFGCAMCPPKFKKDPVKYGEAALKNHVAE